jgi:hypothetical protein
MKRAAAFCVFAALAWPAALRAQQAPAPQAAPTRILVSIGQDIGAPDDERLLYAERDAERMAQLLTRLGDVAPSRSYVVTDASADRVRQVLTEVRGRAMELQDVVLIAYVSGHADEHGLRLGASHLPRAELRALLASIPARLRVLIVDACTSGALIRGKGGKVVKAFAIDLESSQSIEGQVVIASTGPSEPAQEWEALGGALFTHHLLSALRGAADLDSDGRVTLFEAYAYSYDRTLADSTRAHAGAQHPSHEIDLRGAGDLVLTRPGGRSSGLVLGAALSGRYVITDAMSGDLTAELDKRNGRAMRLALDPGRYLIRKPEGAFVRVGEVTVLPSSIAQLDEGDFEQVPYTEVARRGAAPLHLWSIELSSALGSAALAGGVVTPRIGVGVGRELGPWALSAGFELGLEEFRGQSFAIDQRELWGFVESRLRMPLSWALPYLSARGAFGVIQQSMTRDQEQMIQEVFAMNALPARTGTAGQLLVGAGLELPFSRVLLRFEGAGGVTLSAVDRALRARPLGALRLIGAYRF